MHPVTLWILTPQYNRDRGQKYCDPVTLNANFLLNLGIEFMYIILFRKMRVWLRKLGLLSMLKKLI